MNRTMRWMGVGLVFVLCLGMVGAWAQQRPVSDDRSRGRLPVTAEPQAPSRTAQAPSGAVPTNQTDQRLEKARVAGEIIAREQAASGRPFDAAFVDQMRSNLANLSLEQLAEVQQRASGLLPIPNIPGATQSDLVYTPVTPCRIIDTRLGGGPIAAGSTRDFIVSGICGVPFGPATAAVINLVAVGPAGAGDLRIAPFGTAIPGASIINYTSGLNLANGPAVKICNPNTTTCSFDITIQADVSSTDLVADVLGYFAVPSCQLGSVKALGACYETSTRTAATVFVASDTCKGAGGRLATGLELHSLRGGSPLTLDATGEWVDSVYVNGSTFTAMIVRDDGLFTAQSTITSSPFRCVYLPLP
jgi:hypothetical protein